MKFLLLSINYALMVILPIILAVYIHRRTGAAWRLFFIGAVTFIASQALHIPFNWLVGRSGLLPDNLDTWRNLLVTAAFLGLSAGVFEETARYLSYRYWAKDARSWSRGLMLGAGHGGIEAILLGLLSVVSFAGLLVTARSEAIFNTIPADQQAVINDSLAEILNLPWYGLLLGALERVFALAAHLALSVMVLQVFLRRSILWLFLAIAYHAAFNMLAVVAVTRAGPYVTEALLGVMSLVSLFIIFRLREPEPVEPEPSPLPDVEPVSLTPTEDAIDRSRYS